MTSRNTANRRPLIFLLAGYATGTGLLVLMGFSLPAAVQAAAVVVCPALLIWLYLSPRTGNFRSNHDKPI